MVEKHTSDNPAELSPREATSAKPVKGMPYVLGISVVCVVILFAVVLTIFM